MSLVKVDVLAKLFSLTPRRVQQLAKEGVIPRTGRGEYELGPAVQGYVRFLQERAAGAPSAEGGGDLLAERTKGMRLSNELTEIELGKAKGELVGLAEAVRAYAGVMVEIRASLLETTPARIAAAVVGLDGEGPIRRAVKEELRSVLERVADLDPAAVLGSGDDGARAGD